MKKVISSLILLSILAAGGGVAFPYPYPLPTPVKHETDSTLVGSQVGYGYTAGDVLTAIKVNADGSIPIGGTYLREISFIAPSFAQVAGKPDRSPTDLYYLFDPDTDESIATVRFSMPSYLASGEMISYRVRWYSETTATDDVVWAVAWRMFSDTWTSWQTDTLDAVANSGNDVPNESAWVNLTDGLYANNTFEFLFLRDANSGFDDLQTDAKFGEIMFRTYLNFAQ